mgnify:CR=1 FL=1
MEKDNKVARTGEGSIRIADEVVSVIAGLAATEVPGVAGMSAGLVGGIADMLGRKNLAKGVKVEVGEKEALVNLYIIAEFGVNIRDVATNIQEKVRESIETMTGLKVVEVNVHVQGVELESDDDKDDKEVRVR